MIREFVSYPKSGRSWIRYALATMDVDKNIRFHHDQFEFSDPRLPAHNFELERRIANYAQLDRLVYLERDPRDVIVSLYHQVTGRLKDMFHYEKSISEFIRDDYFGAETLMRFRILWSHLSKLPNCLVVSYENCHMNFESVLQEIVRHFSLSVSDEAFRHAIEIATFEKMKLLEENDGFSESWLRKRNGFGKVREGIVGGYKASLCDNDIKFLNEVFGLPSRE